MKLSEFDYKLPQELIAQNPIKKRSNSRLMIINKKVEHKKFYKIINYFNKDDILVLNNTKVFPARILGKKQTGGKVQILIIKKKTTKKWTCLYSGKKIKEGTKIFFDLNLEGIISKKQDYNIEITFNKKIDDLIDKIGKMPTPPYIKTKLTESERYNTVFAKEQGSIAAPTAGLHFTQELLDKIKQKGIKIVYITLHVGLGTFLPVKEEEISKHKMHSEYFKISKKTAKIINERKKKLFICGTTTLRALESSCNKKGKIIPTKKCTNIFIYPPYKFNLQFNGMITNFHSPKSTLLMLVSTIIERKKLFQAYSTAIKEKYRFFSFGDTMLILKNC